MLARLDEFSHLADTVRNLKLVLSKPFCSCSRMLFLRKKFIDILRKVKSLCLCQSNFSIAYNQEL